MQPYVGLIGIATCLAVSWWNRKCGGYNGARPNWWRLLICAIFALGGLFGIGRTLLHFSPSSIMALAILGIYALVGGYQLFNEASRFRNKRAADIPRMANPWKIFVCFAALASGVDGILRPFRGPLVPVGYAEMAGAMVASTLIGMFGLLGIVWELRHLYTHAKSLK